MDLTSPLTRTAAGLARRTLVPPLIVLDRHVVVPVLGDRSTAHRLLAAVTGATAAVTSHPTAAPTARGPQHPSTPEKPAEADTTEDEATDAESDAPTTDESAAPESLTSSEQERIEELTEQLLEDESTGPFVGELADDELRRAQAQVRAKQLVEEQDAAGSGSDGS